MTITALATANTTIGPAQYADMAQALAPRFLVDTPTDLQPSYSGGNVYLQTGAALAAGTRIRLSGSNGVRIPTPGSGTQYYSVVVRIDWSKGASDAATLVCIPGYTINQTSTFNANQINRIPGVAYDALVAIVSRTAGSSAASVMDMRMWGGDGGPIRVTQAGLTNCQWLDVRCGTIISTDKGQFSKRLDDNGQWADIGTPSNPWKLWTPTMRYYGQNEINGTSGGTTVQLGSGATCQGRYRVVDGMLDGYVQIIPSGQNQFGTGALTIDLPLACADWQPDTWSMGHIFTTQGDGHYDWHAEVLVKAGWTRGMIWTNPSQGNARLEPHRSSDQSGNAGTGIPFIAGGWSAGSVYTFHLNYPVAQ